MMIKKANVFFDKSLRNKGVETLSSKGYASATEFIKLIMNVGAFPPVLPLKETDPHNTLVKFFDGMHSQSDWLRNTVGKTIRLQVIVSMLFSDIVTVELFFFGKENKKMFELKTHFQKEDGAIAGGIGYSACE